MKIISRDKYLDELIKLKEARGNKIIIVMLRASKVVILNLLNIFYLTINRDRIFVYIEKNVKL